LEVIAFLTNLGSKLYVSFSISTKTGFAFCKTIIVLVLVFFAEILGNVVVSYSILSAFIVSGIMAFILATNSIRRIFLLCTLTIILGIIGGYLVNQVIPNDYIIGIVGTVITIISLFLLRVITRSDLLYLIDKFKP